MKENVNGFSDIKVSHETATVLKALASWSKLFNDFSAIDDVALDKAKCEAFSGHMNAIGDMLDKELLLSIHSQQEEDTAATYTVI